MRLGAMTCCVSALLAAGCDQQGVLVGTEELCEADPALQAAAETSAEPVPPCARLGVNLLINAGFEEPPATCFGMFCSLSDSEVPGWTTSAADQTMELWRDGYLGVPAAAEDQIIELDANSADTLSQNVPVSGDQLVYWSFQHRGRNGLEQVEVLIGPPGAQESQGSFLAGTARWRRHSGLYRVASDATRLRFSIASRTGDTEGNLVDDAMVAPVE